MFFLGMCLIVTVMALGTLTLTRVSASAAAAGNDWENAGSLAFSATEQALATLNTQAAAAPATWRSGFTSGQTAFTQSLNGGTFSWALKDETDGNLNTDALRPFRLYGIGRSGAVTRVYSVQVLAAGSALDVLRTGLHTSSTLKLTANSRAVNGPFSSNTSVNFSGTVNGSIEAPVVSGSAGGTQTITTASAKQMPSSSVLSTLAASATTIPYASISGGNLQQCLLSAGSNPYGPVAANGVYLINVPVNQQLQIMNCRIAATLLVTGGGNNNINITGPCAWDPASSGLPALVVSAPSARVNISGSDSWLTESGANANLNPASTPYNGASDTTLDDDYPPQYHGIFHFIVGSGGTVTVKSNGYFVGTLITDCPTDTKAQSTFVQDPAIAAAPPTGYARGDALAINPGTWRWDTLP